MAIYLGKLLSSLESSTEFAGKFKVTSVPVFIPDFNVLSCELFNFTFKILSWIFLYYYYVKTKQNYNTITALCKKSTTVSIIEYVAVCSVRSRFAVKLIFCIAFGSASSACCLLKSIAIYLKQLIIILL